MEKDGRFSRKVFWAINAIACAFFIALMVVATKYDLEINHALSDGDSFFADLFAIIGEFPAYFAVPVGGVIVFFNAQNFNEKYKRVLIRIVGCLAVFGGWFFFFYAGTKLTDVPHLLGFSLTGAAGIGAVSLWVGSLVKKETMNKLFKYGVFLIVFTLVTLAVIQISKNVFCRMRYRDMLKDGDFDGFTPWYKINIGRENPNPDYHYTSFPSGHTSSAAHVFVLCVLCDLYPALNKKRVRAVMNVCCFAFTAVVAIARIVDDAHFLSDVLVGGYVTYLIFVLCRYIFFGKGKYNFRIADKKDEEGASLEQ